VFDGGAPSIRVCLFGTLSIIQHLHKEEVGHLLKDSDGIGDTSCPKGIPYRIDAIFNISSNHVFLIFPKINSGDVKLVKVEKTK
ncbi:MAG: hypothetical protein J6R21_05190, partial [Bacteroidales bacterium]|nr:hypothetical protein [Bacteroidales bacterium]